MRALKILGSRRRAQNYVEYGLVVAVVALVVMVGANNLSVAESAYFTGIGPSLAPAAPTYTPIGLPTVVTVATATGTYGGTVNLTATLTTPTYPGTPVSGKTLSFMLNATAVCGGTTGVTCPTTNGSGVATLSNVSLSGIHAGTYTTGIVAQFQGDSNYQIGTGTGTLIVNQASQTITFAQPTSPWPYLGTFSVSPTASSGLQTVVTASGVCSAAQSGTSFTITMTAASGNCILTANQSGNGDYLAASPVSVTVAATKAQAIITITNTNQTYDGSARPVTVTTNPTPLDYTVTYNGGSTVPVNAGTYSVSVTVNDANYQGTQSATLVVQQAPATITLSNLNVIYNAKPQAATITTAPSGLTTVVTYNGGSTQPTNAGAYTVNASINDPNYTGSTSGTMTVSAAPTKVLVDAKTVTSANKTSVTLSGSVYATGGSPVPAVNQGTLTFSVSGATGNPCSNTLSAVTVSSAGAASVTCNITNPVSSGNTFTISGTFNSTAPNNFATSTGTAGMKAVANGQKDTNLTVSPAVGSVSGGSVNLQAVLTDIANGGVGGKTISFSVNGTAVCGGSTGVTCPNTNNSNGVASVTINLPAMASNTYAITATWAGDSSANASSGTAELTVN